MINRDHGLERSGIHELLGVFIVGKFIARWRNLFTQQKNRHGSAPVKPAATLRSSLIGTSCCALEPLEPRVLLSAVLDASDLSKTLLQPSQNTPVTIKQPNTAPASDVEIVGTIKNTPKKLKPNRSGRVSVQLSNTSADPVSGTATVRLFLSQDQALDETDRELVATINQFDFNLKPNKRKRLKVKFDSPTNITPGDYHILAFLNTDSPQSQPLSGVVASKRPVRLNNQFQPQIVTIDDPSNHVIGFDQGFDGVVPLSLDFPTFSGTCSGTLLPTGHDILTAAHCVTNDDGVLDVTNVTATFSTGQTAQTVLLSDFNNVDFTDLNGSTFGTWDPDPATGVLAVTKNPTFLAVGNQATESGGAIATIQSVDLTGLVSIEARARLGPNNQADSFVVQLRDADGTEGSWDFDTSTLEGPTGRFITLRADLASPDRIIAQDSPIATLDLTDIVAWQLQGDFSSNNPFSLHFGNLEINANPNLPPIAIDDDRVTTVVNQPVVIDVLANDFDPEGMLDPASISIVPGTGPTGGALTINPLTGQLTYTPNTGFLGLDSFQYTVADLDQTNKLTSNQATVSINVSAMAAATGIVLSDFDGTDFDANAATPTPPGGFTFVSWVGTVTPDAAGFIEVGGTEKGGLGEFVTSLDISSQQVIEVHARLGTNNNQADNFVVVLKDTDGTEVQYRFSTSGLGDPTGTFAVIRKSLNDPGAFTFKNGTTPGLDLSQIESWNLQGDFSSDASLSLQFDHLEINPNIAPVAIDDTVSRLEDSLIQISVLDNDFDSENALLPNTVTVTSGPANGSTIIDPTTGVITYIPLAGFVGTDTFTYTVSDIDNTPSNQATVTIFALNPNGVALDATEIFVHPDYDGNVLHGNDIAIVRLPFDAPDDAQPFDIFRQSNEVGQIGTKVGFGISGIGSEGTTGPSALPSGTRRSVQNRYDATADIFDGLSGVLSIGQILNGDRQLAYDFDDGTTAHDAFGVFFGANDPSLIDAGLDILEGNSAPGDSGGPTFLRDAFGNQLIAGVTSYGLAAPLTDITPTVIDSSIGEFSVDTRVSSFADWIDDILITAGPIVNSHQPSAINTAPSPVSFVDFHFSRLQMDTTSFDAVSDVVSFTGPGGVDLLSTITGFVTTPNFTWIDSNTLRIRFNAQLANGSYEMVIGPNILGATDLAPMDQNLNSIAGELGTADTYTAQFSINEDRFEDNDSPAITIQRPQGATNSPNLGVLVNPVTLTGLNMFDGEDWYLFEMLGTGQSTDQVQIQFFDFQGDLDLELYADDGSTLLDFSNSFTDDETISLDGLLPGDYFVRVFGFAGATNPDYTLIIDPGSTTAAPGTPGSPTSPGSGGSSGLIPSLSIEQTPNQITRSSNRSHLVDLEFSNVAQQQIFTSATVSLFLSTDQTFDAGDFQLQTRFDSINFLLDPGESTTRRVALLSPLASELAAGDYFLVATIIDSSGASFTQVDTRTIRVI